MCVARPAWPRHVEQTFWFAEERDLDAWSWAVTRVNGLWFHQRSACANIRRTRQSYFEANISGGRPRASLLRGQAPWWSRSAITLCCGVLTGRLPTGNDVLVAIRHAACIGVSPRASAWFGSAPMVRSTATAARQQRCAALCRGDSCMGSSPSMRLAEAPYCSSSSNILCPMSPSMRQCCSARWMGRRPWQLSSTRKPLRRRKSRAGMLCLRIASWMRWLALCWLPCRTRASCGKDPILTASSTSALSLLG
mmetsp:Transcript_15168/g.45470  ORF Transcript_15168/g.45470 Transcript_15168/m.45470 type:complete len:251 (-) Transcript_15168:12-764(-)